MPLYALCTWYSGVASIPALCRSASTAPCACSFRSLVALPALPASASDAPRLRAFVYVTADGSPASSSMTAPPVASSDCSSVPSVLTTVSSTVAVNAPPAANAATAAVRASAPTRRAEPAPMLTPPLKDVPPWWTAPRGLIVGARAPHYNHSLHAARAGAASRRPPTDLAVDRDEERDDQDRDDVRDLDHRVDRGAGGVLVGVADGVAGDRRGMRLGALAAVRPVLDQLLRVVPGAATRGHRDREEEAGHDRSDQEPAEHLGADDPDRARDRHGDQRRQHHLVDRRLGDDVDGAAVVRPLGALHDPGHLLDLPPHLDDDFAADPADGRHGERREEERHHPADEEAGDHVWIAEVEAHVQPFFVEA